MPITHLESPAFATYIFPYFLSIYRTFEVHPISSIYIYICYSIAYASGGAAGGGGSVLVPSSALG